MTVAPLARHCLTNSNPIPRFEPTINTVQEESIGFTFSWSSRGRVPGATWMGAGMDMDGGLDGMGDGIDEKSLDGDDLLTMLALALALVLVLALVSKLPLAPTKAFAKIVFVVKISVDVAADRMRDLSPSAVMLLLLVEYLVDYCILFVYGYTFLFVRFCLICWVPRNLVWTEPASQKSPSHSSRFCGLSQYFTLHTYFCDVFLFKTNEKFEIGVVFYKMSQICSVRCMLTAD